MENIFQYILNRIGELDPLQAKKIKKSVNKLGPDYFAKAEKFYNKYIQMLEKNGKTIDYGIDCYLRMCSDVAFEQISFIETGKYSSSSFEEVNKRVYGNPEVMEYYMHGLLMSEMLWLHHYKIFNFFKENFANYAKNVKRYLEVGGGHGAFIQEAVNMLGADATIHVVDISESSIEMAKQFVEGGNVQYNLQDVYKYEVQVPYDFIVMGEVLEHVEDAVGLLKKLNSLLSPDGMVFITTPTNAPAIDHIYLFRNRQDIIDVIDQAGFSVVKESCIYAEDVPEALADEMKITMMYAGFLKKK